MDNIIYSLYKIVKWYDSVIIAYYIRILKISNKYNEKKDIWHHKVLSNKKEYTLKF